MDNSFNPSMPVSLTEKHQVSRKCRLFMCLSDRLDMLF